jgi:hypothetical protein
MRKLVCTLLLGVAMSAIAQNPSPLPGNPGNIFVEGQDVSIPAPEGASSWRAVDENGKSLGQGSVSGGRIDMGKQPVGFYSIRLDGARREVTAAVVPPVDSPRPAESPMGINANFLFLHKEDPEHWNWQAYGSIVALTGMAWERDAFRWNAVQPEKDGPLRSTVFDKVPEYMHSLGMHVLYTMVAKPAWLTENDNFPSVDLREPYNSFREIAARWRGTVDAFEPMNEWDIKSNGAELAAYTKAYYLGVKVGNPEAIAGTPAFSAAMVPQELQEFEGSGTAPYFDSVNFHHYLEPDDLPRHYKVWAQVAHGKQLWPDEFNLHIPRIEDPESGSPAQGEMIRQAQQIAMLYASVLYLDSAHLFYFTLPNFTQEGKQWGLLYPDFTPRPGYVALAAVGRYLANAKVIGKLSRDAYAFHASPGGTARDVIVAWGHTSLNLPANPVEAYDYMGRKIAADRNFKVPQTPVFIVLPEGSVTSGVTPPPAVERAAPTKAPSPVILQVAFSPQERTFLRPEFGPQHASASVANVNGELRVFIYNLSNKTYTAHLSAEGAELEKNSIELPPMCRIPLRVSTRGHEIRLHATGDFGDSVLLFHVSR